MPSHRSASRILGAVLALASLASFESAATAGAQTWPVEPLVLRISDAWVTPGGEAAIVVRTYASRPVRRGRLNVRATPPAGAVPGAGAVPPIASWNGGILFDIGGSQAATVIPGPDGQSVDLDFLTNPDFVFNRRDGVVAVLYATISPSAVPGTDYDLLGDDALSELRDPEDDLVDFTLRGGRLRIRSAAAPFELGTGNVEVHPGSAARIEISTAERFAIGSGTLVLDYDPAVLLPGHQPTASADGRHGTVALVLDTSAPGRITIDLDSADGSWNAEVPGDLLVVHLPTLPGIPMGSNSNVTFNSSSALFAPGGAPLPVFLENGQLQFRERLEIFRDNFEIADTGWWSEVAP
ncbi:MAG: hypothetical protein F9K16_12005 [Thermoanaerobaculia bacterium]|nr:MAG: hypothetical protein F9K16_12005 [Thermoanaerobaculia bacterium]